MPATAATLSAALALVDAAITKALEAQSYSVGGRSKTNASIDALFKRRDQLQQQYDRVSGAAPMLVRSQVTGLR